MQLQAVSLSVLIAWTEELLLLSSNFLSDQITFVGSLIPYTLSAALHALHVLSVSLVAGVVHQSITCTSQSLKHIFSFV